MIEGVVATGGETTELSLDNANEPSTPVWVRVTDASAEELDRVAETFEIHPLAIADLSGMVRTKTEEYPDYTFVFFEAAELTPDPNSSWESRSSRTRSWRQRGSTRSSGSTASAGSWCSFQSSSG